MKFLPKIFASIIFSSLNYLRERKSTLSMFNPKPYNIFYFKEICLMKPAAQYGNMCGSAIAPPAVNTQ